MELQASQAKQGHSTPPEREINVLINCLHQGKCNPLVRTLL